MSITSRINEMSSHIEQAYDELQGLGADLTNVNKNIENISMVLDDIYDSMPQVSGEGTNLTLDDTRVGKIKSTLKGNTSQSGTPTPTSPIPVNVVSGNNSVVVCGKNLLNLGNKEETTDTNGLTYKVENNVITISGTNTSSSAYSLFSWWDKDVVLENRFQKGSTFTVSSDKSVSGLYFQINYDKEGTSSQGSLVSFALSGDKATFTVPQDFGGINHIFIGVYGTATTINTSFSIQLEYGSTKSSFMPFDMSQYDINLIVSKNIFNINTILRGYDLTAATGAIKQNATWYVSDFIGVKPSTNYTSTNISSGVKCWYNKNKTFISYTTSTTATSPVNARYMRVNGTLASIESDSNLMIEEGSSASTYVPYESIELCKIGTPQDYFYKQNGNWYLYKIIYKKIFNETDTIQIVGSSETRTIITYATGVTLESYAGGSVVPNILCTHLISASQDATWVPGDISRRNQNPMSLFYILEAGLTTTTGLQWLVNNNVVTYTPMAEPIVTEITYQPLIDQLNELEKKAMSKDGQTNISQVNNDLPFIISASALKEWQESTSLNSTLSMVNPLSLGNTLNTQEIDNNTQPIEVDNIEPLEEEENEES